MPRDAQGQYSLPNGTLVSAGQTIQVSQHNPAMQDIAAGISQSLSRTGQGAMQADLAMGGFGITNAKSIGSSGTDDLDLRAGGAIAIKITPDLVTHFSGGTVPASGKVRVLAKDGYAISTYSPVNYIAVQFVRQVSGTPVQIGTISVTDTTVSLLQGSDYRLKNIAGPLTGSGGFIDGLRPVEGTWKVNGSAFVGFLAHEVQDIARTDIVLGERDGPSMQSMNYAAAEIIANLVAETQSLRARVALLEA